MPDREARSRSSARKYLGGVRESFGVNEVLAFVLEFDVGAHSVDIQSDAGFLKFGGLVVKALGEGDTRGGGIASGERTQNEEVLVDDGSDDDLAGSLLVGASFATAFLIDLIITDQREI